MLEMGFVEQSNAFQTLSDVFLWHIKIFRKVEKPFLILSYDFLWPPVTFTDFLWNSLANPSKVEPFFCDKIQQEEFIDEWINGITGNDHTGSDQTGSQSTNGKPDMNDFPYPVDSNGNVGKPTKRPPKQTKPPKSTKRPKSPKSTKRPKLTKPPKTKRPKNVKYLRTDF